MDAQTAKIRAILTDVIIDAGESAKSLHRPGMVRLLALVDAGAVDTVIIAKLDRLTRSVADLAELLKRFERRGVSLVSVAKPTKQSLRRGEQTIEAFQEAARMEVCPRVSFGASSSMHKDASHFTVPKAPSSKR